MTVRKYVYGFFHVFSISERTRMGNDCFGSKKKPKKVMQRLDSDVVGLDPALGDVTELTPLRKANVQQQIYNEQLKGSIKNTHQKKFEQKLGMERKLDRPTEKQLPSSSYRVADHKSIGDFEEHTADKDPSQYKKEDIENLKKKLHIKESNAVILKSMLFNLAEMKTKLDAIQSDEEHQCYGGHLQPMKLPYKHFQQQVYEGKTAPQSKINLKLQRLKSKRKSVKDFQQQCYNGRSRPDIKIYDNFQQQVYEGKSAPQSKEDLNLQKFKLKSKSVKNFQQQCYNGRSKPDIKIYDNFQQQVYEGRSAPQSKEDLCLSKVKTPSKSVLDFQQQCYDGRSQPNIKIYHNFQQQVYERQSTIDFQPRSYQPQLTYTVGDNLISADDLRLADDNYPRRDIVMIVMMVKNLEHILQSKYQAQGDNLCMYFCLSHYFVKYKACL